MKLTINIPQNGYAGWTGFLTDADGKRHRVGAELQAAFETKAALIKRAKYLAHVITSSQKRYEETIARFRAGGTE